MAFRRCTRALVPICRAIVFVAAAKFVLLLAASVAFAQAEPQSPPAPKQIEQWGVFEIELPGPNDGNPFVDVELSASFKPVAQTSDQPVTAHGFYDGDRKYCIRFMPGKLGAWEYTTHSNRPALDGQHGNFTVVAPSPGNHGPVQVRNTYHFAYADGTPFFPFGTTCYGWTQQPEKVQQQTLDSLAHSPFNKVRMIVLPSNFKDDAVALYPYEGQPPDHWDFTRFNPAFFRHLEQCISQLDDRGIQADVILFHPYDKGRYGFGRMPAAADDLYLRYIVARLSAYRNVW